MGTGRIYRAGKCVGTGVETCRETGKCGANGESVRGRREEKVHECGGKRHGCGASLCGHGGRAWERRKNARAVRETGEKSVREREGNVRSRVNGGRHGGSAHGGAGYAQPCRARCGYPPPQNFLISI